MKKLEEEKRKRITDVEELFRQYKVEVAKQPMPYDLFGERHTSDEIKTIKLSNSTNPIACC